MNCTMLIVIYCNILITMYSNILIVSWDPVQPMFIIGTEQLDRKEEVGGRSGGRRNPSALLTGVRGGSGEFG